MQFMDINFKAKPYNVGTSTVITIPQQYIKDGYIDPKKKLLVTVKEAEENEEVGALHA